MSKTRPPFLLLAAIAAALPAALPAQEAPPAQAPATTFAPVRMIEMRPEEKRPLLLKTSERNPYAKRSPKEEKATAQESNAEELRIRERLGALRITGRSRGPNGLRVLLGDIILEEGRILPQLLEDQSENLRVVELNEDMVVLGWLDIETGDLTGKTMQVAYDLTPSIGYALHGQGPDSAREGLATRRMGVLRVEQAPQRLESRTAANPPSPEIPREAFKAGQ